MLIRPPVHRPHHLVPNAHRRRAVDRRRGSSTERGYGIAWQKARKEFLALNRLCVTCQREGVVRPATVVDHIEPHRGDQRRFWDRRNWQPLCKRHHDRDKQREERSERDRGDLKSIDKGPQTARSGKHLRPRISDRGSR